MVKPPPNYEGVSNLPERARRAGTWEPKTRARSGRRDRASCRRPITDAEVPYLGRLGSTIRGLRDEAGTSRPDVARRAEISVSTLERIEAGFRRTRRSTLERLVRALDKPEALADLIDCAGPALAPESRYRDRVDRRRRRRHSRRRSTSEAEELMRELAHRFPMPPEYANYHSYDP